MRVSSSLPCLHAILGTVLQCHPQLGATVQHAAAATIVAVRIESVGLTSLCPSISAKANMALGLFFVG